MTSYEIDLSYKPLHTAKDILNTLCMNTALAIEEQNLTDCYCNIFIPVSKRLTVFAEVQIVANSKPVFYVTSSKNQSATIPALNYQQAASKLEALLS